MKVKLVVVGGDTKYTEIPLRLPTIVGRGQGCRLRLQHPLVSRQHCEIFEQDGQLMVRDLGSLNGTFVNNEKIGEAPLPSGQLLTIGSVTFRAIYESPAGAERDVDPNKTLTTTPSARTLAIPVTTPPPLPTATETSFPQADLASPDSASPDFDLGEDVEVVEDLEDASGILPPSAVRFDANPADPATANSGPPPLGGVDPMRPAPPPLPSEPPPASGGDEDDELNRFFRSLGK